MSQSSIDGIEQAKGMPLEEWIHTICYTENPDGIMNVAFPTDEHRDQFIETIFKRSEDEVKRLLFNFLIKSCSFGLFDKLKFESFVASRKHAPDIFERASQLQFFKRLTAYMAGNKQRLPWEGNTWMSPLQKRLDK